MIKSTLIAKILGKNEVKSAKGNRFLVDNLYLYKNEQTYGVAFRDRIGFKDYANGKLIKQNLKDIVPMFDWKLIVTPNEKENCSTFVLGSNISIPNKSNDIFVDNDMINVKVFSYYIYFIYKNSGDYLAELETFANSSAQDKLQPNFTVKVGTEFLDKCLEIERKNEFKNFNEVFEKSNKDESPISALSK